MKLEKLSPNFIKKFFINKIICDTSKISLYLFSSKHIFLNEPNLALEQTHLRKLQNALNALQRKFSTFHYRLAIFFAPKQFSFIWNNKSQAKTFPIKILSDEFLIIMSMRNCRFHIFVRGKFSAEAKKMRKKEIP